MVTDRQMLPVGGQRVPVRPEDLADVGGVALARVEVDVVRDVVREVQRDRAERVEERLDVRPVGRAP